jgi:hypothetical protein
VAFGVFPPGLTIQTILADFPGSLPPPDSAFRSIVAGNLKIH